MNFDKEVAARVAANGQDRQLGESARHFIEASIRAQYSYNFSWLGRPIIQYPQDIVAMQELIWKVRPDLIIETGVAHGGSLVLSASMLALLDYCDAVASKSTLDPAAAKRKVLGIDIEVRPHNRAAIESHPMASRIELVEGSSTDPDVVRRVRQFARGYSRVLVCLDSNHTHEHVLAELEAYAGLASIDSYCCVFDTVVEDLPGEMYPDRPWGPGNNPKTAVHEFLRRLQAEGRTADDGSALQFVQDRFLEDKLLITVAPDGYLRRVPA